MCNSEIRNVLKTQIFGKLIWQQNLTCTNSKLYVTLHMMYYRNITCIGLDDVALGPQKGDYLINISALYSLCKIWTNSECQIRITNTNTEMQICPPCLLSDTLQYTRCVLWCITIWVTKGYHVEVTGLEAVQIVLDIVWVFKRWGINSINTSDWSLTLCREDSTNLGTSYDSETQMSKKKKRQNLKVLVIF